MCGGTPGGFTMLTMAVLGCLGRTAIVRMGFVGVFHKFSYYIRCEATKAK
jgi:hypothetical protein